MGSEFDFTALTEVDVTVREDILEELPAETVAEGMRDLDSDDAVEILQALAKEDQAEILEQGCRLLVQLLSVVHWIDPEGVGLRKAGNLKPHIGWESQKIVEAEDQSFPFRVTHRNPK